MDISADQSALQVQQQGKVHALAVVSRELAASVKRYGKGDRVRLQFTQEAERNLLQNESVVAVEVGADKRLFTLAATAAALMFLFWLMLVSRLRDLILGTDDRFSNSKTQIVAWFFVLIVTYVAFTALRFGVGGAEFVGGITIPQHLLLLPGLSALTFATAKGIAASKVRTDGPKQEAGTPRFPRDLFRDDEGRVDLGDFQMIIVTLLAVAVYLVEVFGFLGAIELHRAVTLPDVDTTILATFGLGQGAYLVKKVVNDVGSGKPEPLPAQPPNPNLPLDLDQAVGPASPLNNK